MSFDPRPYRDAIRALNSNRPLGIEDRPQYVDRPDRLGVKVLNRVLEEGGRPLLLSGPPGCGKSTELLWLKDQEMPFRCIHCPCDRDLDLTRVNVEELYRYLMWRILDSVPDLSEEITQEAWGWVSPVQALLGSPRAHFANRMPGYSWPSAMLTGNPGEHGAVLLASSDRRPGPGNIRQTLARLLSEAQQRQRLLLLIDGLEKTPPSQRELVVRFIRERLLPGVAQVVVVPLYLLFGGDALSDADGVDIFMVSFEGDSSSWIREVITRRTGALFENDALKTVEVYSGGVVRDALQLTREACRAAIDHARPVVEHDVYAAVAELAAGYWRILGDYREVAIRALQQTKSGLILPDDQGLRDLLLAQGIVLNCGEGYYRVHPMIAYKLAQSLASGAHPE